jgi:pyrroloquinoline quinone biosynthesis protein E
MQAIDLDVTHAGAVRPEGHESSPVRRVLDTNQILALKDSQEVAWRFRRDDRRILLYEWSKDTLAVGKIYRLHPASAIILALLQGKRYQDALRRAAQLFERSVEEMDKWYERQLAHWMEHDVFVVVQESEAVVPVDPAALAMPADQVDVDQWWLYRPINAVFKLTDACQRTCRYCSVHIDRGRSAMTTEQWLRVLDDAITNGILSVTFVGGDPLLHKGLPELIRFSVNRGVPPFVSTKVFVTDGMAASLVEAGLQKIQISIDSDVDHVGDYLLGSPGATPQLFASIQNCVRAGLEVRTNSVITPYNVLGFPTLARRLRDLGVSRMGTSACGYSVFVDEIDSLLLRPPEARWLEEQVALLKQEGIRATFSYAGAADRREAFDKRAFCSAGSWALIIHADGAVTLCDDLPAVAPFVVGNVLETSMMEIWNGKAIQVFRQPGRELFEGTACFDCNAFAKCTADPRICFRDAYHAYRRVWSPSPYCPRADEAPTRISY